MYLLWKKITQKGLKVAKYSAKVALGDRRRRWEFEEWMWLVGGPVCVWRLELTTDCSTFACEKSGKVISCY